MCILFARRIRSISSGKGKRGVFGDWGWVEENGQRVVLVEEVSVLIASRIWLVRCLEVCHG